jgi:hypothetical protein
MKSSYVVFGLAVCLAFVFAACSPSPETLGGDRDEHGCITSAGYSWCEEKQKCIRIWEENCTDEQLLGDDADEHGCIGSAGYSWCEEKQKCIRIWEESCNDTMTLTQAVEKAVGSECTQKGMLTETSFYNENSRTWWIDLEMKPEFFKENCNPACVVGEASVEINWRCTGLLP